MLAVTMLVVAALAELQPPQVRCDTLTVTLSQGQIDGVKLLDSGIKKEVKAETILAGCTVTGSFGKRLKDGGAAHPGQAEWKPIDISQQDSATVLDVPLERGCAMVRLNKSL